MDWRGRVALVTGANSGIGFSLTERLLEMGMIVIGIDKDISNIKDLNRDLHPLEVDLTKEIEVCRAFEWIEETHGGLDVLINNAGLAGNSSLLDGKTVEWRRLVEVNVLAVALCTAEAVRSMRRRAIHHGQIINITSYTASYVPTYPPFHFYSATKHAAKALTEGFRQELRDLEVPIRISSIEPGLVKTSIFKASLGDQMEKFIYDKHPSIDPSDIASAVEYILNTPQNVNVFEVCVKPLRSEK